MLSIITSMQGSAASINSSITANLHKWEHRSRAERGADLRGRRRDLVAALGARGLHAEPLVDALFVVEVVARQHHHLVVLLVPALAHLAHRLLVRVLLEAAVREERQCQDSAAQQCRACESLRPAALG